jgi:hypothetical protein
MKEIKELRIYDKQSVFIYILGVGSLHHDHKVVKKITPFHAVPEEFIPPSYTIEFECGDHITWNATQVSGVFVSEQPTKSVEDGEEESTN